MKIALYITSTTQNESPMPLEIAITVSCCVNPSIITDAESGEAIGDVNSIHRRIVYGVLNVKFLFQTTANWKTKIAQKIKDRTKKMIIAGK